MPRQARRKSESGIYHVLLRGINQQQIFEDTEDYEKFLQVLKDCKAISEYKLFAYCLMGNHIHLLIKEEKEPLEQIIKRIATRFVYWYNVKYQRIGHLFQDRFKSEPVENDEYFMTVIRYIHQNPLKAGLCKNISSYKFSSYHDFVDDSDLVDKDFVFELIPLEVFKRFHNEIQNDNCLEIDNRNKIRVTDEQARKIIYKYSKCSSAAEFQNLNSDLKEKFIKKFYKNGISIRQIARLCGQSKGMVERCLN
ncbi:MAG: transposase [Clostridia bacterium]|nr:transposase [Clostridia bacterium]